MDPIKFNTGTRVVKNFDIPRRGFRRGWSRSDKRNQKQRNQQKKTPKGINSKVQFTHFISLCGRRMKK